MKQSGLVLVFSKVLNMKKWEWEMVTLDDLGENSGKE